MTHENYCHFTTRVLSGCHNSPDRVSDDICPDKIAIICHNKQEKYNQKALLIPKNNALHSPCGSFRLETGRHAPQHRVSAGSTMRLSSAAPQSTFSKARFGHQPLFEQGSTACRPGTLTLGTKTKTPSGEGAHSTLLRFFGRRTLWPHAALDYEAGRCHAKEYPGHRLRSKQNPRVSLPLRNMCCGGTCVPSVLPPQTTRRANPCSSP